ncbi:hypothetical protein [Nocardia rhizosphaerihabitans]|uniref:Mce-associated membrane protein n=1 Tax=Nocardia rhizosphaerihabitans TaxID=1691570 RepID=A0ABQ2L0Z4_9NOCA|nr:hypothetical protein [Nocardia rhizosphaerihabitans]GGN97280.1 hypothetical protein GCM10011610_63140 [Nocardia rhizosphaerihabitans]
MSDTETAVADLPTDDVKEPADKQDSPTSKQSGDATAAEAAPAAAGLESRDEQHFRGIRLARVARRAAVPALALVAVAALVGVGVLGWQLREERAVDSAAEAALQAARAYAVTLTSVDSNNLDRDFTAVLDGSTGEFRDMYTRSSGQLRQLLQENKATGKGAVLDAAVKSATETEVEVLLFIDQTVTNAASTDPRVDRSRVLMTMQLIDGRWLASRVYLP